MQDAFFNFSFPTDREKSDKYEQSNITMWSQLTKKKNKIFFAYVRSKSRILAFKTPWISNYAAAHIRSQSGNKPL